MFLRFWMLGRRYFSVSLPFCLLIGRTFVCCACFALLVARLALLYGFRALLLTHWPHVCWLCMFLHFWLLGRHSFSERKRSAYRATISAKRGTTSKRAANKQAKRQVNAKGAPTKQPKEQKHAQPTNMRPISKKKRQEMLKERLPSNQIHRWGWGPMKACNSGPKLAVLHAQSHRWGLGPIETSNSRAKHVVLYVQIHRWGLGPIDTCISGAKYAVLCAQFHRWGLGPIETCNSGAHMWLDLGLTSSNGWFPVDALMHPKYKHLLGAINYTNNMNKSHHGEGIHSQINYNIII